MFCVVRSNPSPKRSANGRPSGPVWRTRYIFASPAWRPAVVAHLARTLERNGESVQKIIGTAEVSIEYTQWHGGRAIHVGVTLTFDTSKPAGFSSTVT
jgi:hypothetical protein